VPTTSLPTHEFLEDPSKAERAAQKGRVFITSEGKPTHVLLSVEEYRRITDERRNLSDALAMPDVADIELEIP
jgi:prevent-host-death family protein